jgi:anti-sigma factor RsiW
MSTLSDTEREEISLLLPWYANGRLSKEESLRVEAALAQDASLAQEYDLVLEDQAAMIELVSEEEVPLSMSERFKAALHAEPDTGARNAAPRETGESFFSRLLGAFAPSGQRRFATAVALAFVLVPAVVIVSNLAGPDAPGLYDTASGDEEPAFAGVRVLVKVRPAVAWSAVDTFLRENGGQIVTGPTADGLYELTFEDTGIRAETLPTNLFEFAFPAE